MDALAALAVQMGPWGIVSLVVVSLIRGWLIPRRTHLDRVEDLKAANAALEATVQERERQIGILLNGVSRREPGS